MDGTVLLTGATGFLGASVLAEACRAGEAADWLALVRGADEAACRARLARALACHLGAEGAERAARTVGVVVGDLAALPGRDDPRLDAVARVVHLAADTSFTAKAAVWRANVDGTLALAARARRMPRLARFLHVGTAFCCGEAPRSRVVPEAPPPPDGAPHIVEYTRSKAAAEAALAAAFPELPVVVARPSIVVGHSELGCAPSSSIFWYYRVLDRTGLLPCPPDGGIDVVPADWAARAILALLRAPELAHRLYHVSAGEGRRTLFRAFAEAFAAAGHGGARPYRFLDPAGPEGWRPFDAAFRAAFPQRDVLRRTMASGTRKYHRFVAQDVVFDNRRLLAEGVGAPPRFVDYLARCLELPGAGIEEQFMDDAGIFGLDARPS